MPVSYNYMSFNDLSKMFKVEKKINKIYTTFRTVVHNFLYNMIFNITKHQGNQEKKLTQPKPEPTVKVTRPRGRRTRGIPNEFKQLREEKREKQIRERNIKIDFRTDKMSVYLQLLLLYFQFIICKFLFILSVYAQLHLLPNHSIIHYLFFSVSKHTITITR